MVDRPKWIRRFPRGGRAGTAHTADQRPTLLIFPHAGTGASHYRRLAHAFGDRFDVVVVQYPGRQDRAPEPAAATLAELASGAFAEFRTSAADRGAPVSLFGHSMGAYVAFEFARLAEAEGIEVAQLTVSAAVAPSKVADKPPHPTDDEAILDHLGALQGTGADVLADRDVMAMALPVVKGDYRAFDAYACPPGVAVAAPVHAIGGDKDPFVSAAELYGWAEHGRDLQVTLFDGGHFFLDEHAAEVAELLAGGVRHAG